MQRKILWLTFKKVLKLFLILVVGFGFGALSMLAGSYFLGDPTKGLTISLFVAIIIFAIVFAYDHSKWEVEREHNDLIRKIKK
jgi:hypothetical protein